MKIWGSILLLFLLFSCDIVDKKNSTPESTSYVSVKKEQIDYKLIDGKEILDSTVNNLFFQFTFIETDTSSNYYELITDFDIRSLETYQLYLDSLLVNYSIFRNYQFIGDWVQIHKFRGEYFLYIPAHGVFGKTIVTDSTIVDFMMDGCYPNLITSSDNEGESVVFGLHYPGHIFAKQDFILQRSIEYFDRKNEIIKISISDDGKFDNSKYYIPRNRAVEYPIIIEYTDNHTMVKEFKFNKI